MLKKGEIMNCPKCDSEVENKARYIGLGLLGKGAFPKFVCPVCGKLENKEFSKTARAKITGQRILCVVMFFIALAFVIFITL